MAVNASYQEVRRIFDYIEDKIKNKQCIPKMTLIKVEDDIEDLKIVDPNRYKYCKDKLTFYKKKKRFCVIDR